MIAAAPQAPYFEHNAYHFVTVVKHAALPEALLLSPMTPNCPMANHVRVWPSGSEICFDEATKLCLPSEDQRGWLIFWMNGSPKYTELEVFLRRHVKWASIGQESWFFVGFGSKPVSETWLWFQKIKIIIFPGLQMMPVPILHLSLEILLIQCAKVSFPTLMTLHTHPEIWYCTKWGFPNHIVNLRSLWQCCE